MRVTVLLLLVACAPMTEQERYEREDALIVAKEQYEQRRLACQQQGGVMVIKRHASRETEHDYRLAQCVRW